MSLFRFDGGGNLGKAPGVADDVKAEEVAGLGVGLNVELNLSGRAGDVLLPDWDGGRDC